MRVLVCTTAGAGHFGPMAPFGRACMEAGHDVVVAAPASFAPAVRSAGFEHAPFDDVAPEVMSAVFARLPGLPTDEANAVVMRDVFGRLDSQAALPAMTATISTWRPHVVLREPCEFASWVAAGKAGVPQVRIGIGLYALNEILLDHAADALHELRSLAGVTDDQSLDTLRSSPYFTVVPPSFDSAPVADVTPLRFRHSDAGSPEASLPPPWGDPALPFVYVTFGSVTATLGPFGSIYPAVVAALADVPARILLTTGEGMDPASIGPVPANLRIERWWPQADVMPGCAAVVGHGGFGTTITTLAAGVPQVVVPLFASDQFLNGTRIAELGAGVCLEGGVDAAGGLPDALQQVLADPSYRAIAGSLADEIGTLPPMSAAVPIIERLALR